MVKNLLWKKYSSRLGNLAATTMSKYLTIMENVPFQ